MSKTSIQAGIIALGFAMAPDIGDTDLRLAHADQTVSLDEKQSPKQFLSLIID